MAELGDKSYTHIQTDASKNWVVTHRLGKHPAISIVNGSGIEIFGLVKHLDDSVVKIEFSTAMAGRAYCN